MYATSGSPYVNWQQPVSDDQNPALWNVLLFSILPSEPGISTRLRVARDPPFRVRQHSQPSEAFVSHLP